MNTRASMANGAVSNSTPTSVADAVSFLEISRLAIITPTCLWGAYSFLSFTAGFVFAALRVCQRMERRLTAKVMTTASTKIHQYPSSR